MPVLQLALKFGFGNRALKNSAFEVFKYTREAEADALASSIIKSFERDPQSGKANRIELARNKQKHNLLLSILNQKIAFRVWKEYLHIRSKFTDREGGIVSEKELNKLISKQRLEEMKFYSKQQSIMSQKDIPIKQASSEMIASFHHIFKELRKSSFFLL